MMIGETFCVFFSKFVRSTWKEEKRGRRDEKSLR